MALCSRESALAASYGSMGGSSSYGSSSSSSSSSSYDYSSSLFESEPLSYSSNESSTIICNCNCSNENQNKPLNRKFLCHKEKEVKNLIEEPYVYFCFLLALTAIAIYGDEGRSGSVVMVQVGIADKDRALQKRLNKIADSADTSTLDGLNYVLKVVKALLKHYDSCHFAYFYDKYDRSMNNTMRPLFEQLLHREINRHDKDENTFVNVDGVKYKATVVDKANSTDDNEYSVVTLLVLASEFQLNESLNRSIGNMKLLLQKLLFIQKNNIESVEVLWTPQREDETVLEKEIHKDFPLLSIF